MLEFVRIQRAFPLYARRFSLAWRGAPFRAVHLSDLHLEDGFDEGWLRRLVARVNAERPDVVFFTGDFTCRKESFETAGRACRVLRRIQAPVIAVEGNHDYLGGAAEKADELAWESGFFLLKNSDITLKIKGAEMQVIGLPSLYRTERYVLRAPEPDEEIYRVCLAHEPGWAARLPAGYADVILSGHTHGGQITAGGMERLWMPRYWAGFSRGEYETRAGRLIVSGGLGESGPHARLGSPREYGVLTWGSDE